MKKYPVILGNVISIHALLAESDFEKPENVITTKISIHALLAESDVTVLGIQHRVGISIHALLAESDDTWMRGSRITYVISIHALLAESDHPVTVFIRVIKNFYPRSPCGERPFEKFEGVIAIKISIHALLAESDTHTNKTNGGTHHISIHALLAESDPIKAYNIIKEKDFYPRSPCGERQSFFQQAADITQFLSTLSLRRATPQYSRYHTGHTNFYPRSPCGERRRGAPVLD